MPIPSYGAAPLSKSFVVTRAMQVIAMLIIVSLTANFVSLVVSQYSEPPKPIVGALSIACIATLYCIVSVIYYWSGATLGLFAMAGADLLLLIAFIVVAVTVGKPVSFLNCYAAGGSPGKDVEAAEAVPFANSLISNINKKDPVYIWAGLNRSNCLETKAIWGVSICLCILFTVSTVLLPSLWYKNKKAGAAPPKDVEG